MILEGITLDDLNDTVGQVAAVLACAVEVGEGPGVLEGRVVVGAVVKSEWENVQKPAQHLRNSRSASPHVSRQSEHAVSRMEKTPMGALPLP
jgi:hypothetical protein